MHDTPEIHKFGGSCLRDASDIKRIAEVVLQAEQPIIIVVSALWGTTDRLIRAAQEPRYAGRLVNDLSSQHLRFSPTIVNSKHYQVFQLVLEGMEKSLVELDTNRDDIIAYNRLLAAGERLSALVIAHELTLYGIEAHPIGAEDIGLCLNGTGKARAVDMERSLKKLNKNAFHGVAVVTGWFGEGLDGNIALLGRGGSDHTATALAALLNARKVVLWKDVPGFFPLNPRWGVVSAPIPYLGYGEAMAFAQADATILHPATVEPVYNLGIPIEIRHLAEYQEGGFRTIIGPDIEQPSFIKGISCIPRVTCVTIDIKYHPDSGQELSQLFFETNNEDIRICSYETTNSNWRFVIPQHEYNRFLPLISSRANQIHVDHYAALISFIGCRDVRQLDGILQDLQEAHFVPYSTSPAIQVLTQREDFALLLEQMMNHLVKQRN